MNVNEISMEVNEQSDSSNSSEDEDQEIVNRAEELEKQISSNKYLYDSHVEIVEIYRKLGDLKSLREAYQRFYEYFPLTPKLWLDWLRDEIKIAQTPEEHKHVYSLFDRAVEDYLSVELWIEYAQYSIGVSNIQTTRAIIERGLTAAGLHVSDGSLLWDTLRELEHAHISLTEEGSEEWKMQLGKLADVFKRQLSVPLLGMEQTYHEWQEWYKNLPEGLIDPKPIEWGYEKALKIVEDYKPFEEKLLEAKSNEELFNTYKEYIQIVKDPSTGLCLYERAAVTLCLIPELWLDYCMYAFQLGETAFKISSRALRNCPWSEELWITKLRIMEHLQKDEKEVLACFEKGISSISPAHGLELWLSYLEYVHRNCKDVEKEDKLFSQAIQQLEFENDPSYKLSRWHARILAKRGDISTARKIWNKIVRYPQVKGTASIWLQYANMERQYGDFNHLRSLFQKALSVCTDWPEYVFEEWLMFEREFGTLETVLKCIEKKKSIRTEAPIRQQNEEYQNFETIPLKGKKRKYDSGEKSVNIKKVRTNSESQKESKEKKEAPPPVTNKHIDKDPKTTVFISNLHPSVGEEELKQLFPNATIINLVHDHKGKSRCYGYLQFSTEEEVMTALARDRVPLDGRPVFISEIKTDKTQKKPVFKYETKAEANKLFVRGLPKNKSKEEIEEIFKPYGSIAVRLVLHKNGQPKGLAYVEFENDEAAKKALDATNQITIDGNVITVAVSAPPPKKPSTSFPKSNEPIRHARSRLQVPLVPRALQIKSAESNGKEATGSTVTSNKSPKSNADFRKLLLKN
ncbi:squamous cell carcinoma antigen recognized by T-cells 3 isoform X1 [Anoplophora glabripennis]|nr:squamous cell carcinoma antigen recognized by T-cells 3 isoform X1 [Anoplophora glabripennis]